MDDSGSNSLNRGDSNTHSPLMEIGNTVKRLSIKVTSKSKEITQEIKSINKDYDCHKEQKAKQQEAAEKQFTEWEEERQKGSN